MTTELGRYIVRTAPAIQMSAHMHHRGEGRPYV
jgi:hypothetical protein